MNDRGSSPGARVPILFGRDADLRHVRQFLEASGRRGGALVLTGEPGVGKGAVLAHAAAVADDDGLKVVTVRGDGLAVDAAFSGLDRIVAPLRHGLRSLAPAHRSALATCLGMEDGQNAERLVLCNAVLSLLRTCAGTRPLTVIVDDAQWLDHGSAEVLAFVARRVSGGSVAFLAALRGGTESPFARPGLTHRQLNPLDEDAAVQLVRHRSPTLATPVVRRLVSEAAGNPLALEELPAVLTEAQRTAIAPLPSPLPLSDRLRALFAARIGDLPPAVRHFLLLAALDNTGDLDVRRPAASDPAVLGPAEDSGLVRVTGSPRRLVFRHPLVVSTVVEMATAIQRRRAHRALAQVLASAPHRRTWHLAEATEDPDEQVAAQLARVAQEGLRRGDAVGAVAALPRAAALTPDAELRRRRLAEAAYLEADVTGTLDNATLILRRDGAAGADETFEGAMAAAYAALNGAGDVDGAHRLLATAVEAHTGAGQAVTRSLAEALHTLLLVCFFGGREELWRAFTPALAPGEHGIPSPLLLCSRTMPDPVRTAAPALDHLMAAIDGLDRVADPTEIIRTGMAACYLDRLTGCREGLWRVVDDGRNGGAIASAIDALLLLAVDDFFTGRWDEAGEMAGQGVDLGHAHRYRLLTWPGYLVRALLAASRGDDGTVRTLSNAMISWAAPRGARTVETYAWHARALSALGHGRYEEAYQAASRIRPAGPRAPHVPHTLWVLLDLVGAGVRSGRRAEARRHAEAMRDADVGALSPRLALVSSGAAAMTTADRAADPLYEAALAVRDAERWPFEFARVELAYGEHLRRRRARTQSIPHLLSALDPFRRLGAHPWTERASGRLRAAGVTVPGNPPPDPDVLSRLELTIVQFAARGLTNRQIGERLYMSHRTVGAHLYRIFPKLGVTSRAALPGALAAAESSPRSLDPLDSAAPATGHRDRGIPAPPRTPARRGPGRSVG